MPPIEMLVMERLNAAPPPPLTVPRVVVSRLTRGETLIAGSAPSLKVVLEGEELYKVDGRVHSVKAGQVLLVDGGAAYEATIGGNGTRGICIHLPEYATLSDGQELALGRAVLRATNTVDGGRELVRLALELHKNGENTFALQQLVNTAKSVLTGGRVDTIRQMSRLDLKKIGARQDVMNRLEAARGHLHATLDRSVTLAELANQAGISVFHFSRYFMAAFGTPPAAYHRSLRLEHARQLLRMRKQTATEVAEAIGYSEIAAFSNAFRREFGFPPSRA